MGTYTEEAFMSFLYVLFLSVLCLFFFFGTVMTLCFILSQFTMLRRTVKHMEVQIIRHRLIFFVIGLSVFMIMNYFAIDKIDALIDESHVHPHPATTLGNPMTTKITNSLRGE